MLTVREACPEKWFVVEYQNKELPWMALEKIDVPFSDTNAKAQRKSERCIEDLLAPFCVLTERCLIYSVFMALTG